MDDSIFIIFIEIFIFLQMNKTFRELFKEENHLSDRIASSWGYQTTNHSLL